jgi:hypothetical protein
MSMPGEHARTRRQVNFTSPFCFLYVRCTAARTANAFKLTCDLLRHGVLHLHTGVDLHKVVLVGLGVHEELHRARVLIVQGLAQLDGIRLCRQQQRKCEDNTDGG